MIKAQEILKRSGLRQTANRKEVLDYLLHKNYAVAHSELEKVFPEMDRVTIYRTLATFIEKGIAHEINDGGGASKYALCSESCSSHQHHDQHVHFKCVKCEQTLCIDTVHIPVIELPEGFQPIHSSYLIEGVCGNC